MRHFEKWVVIKKKSWQDPSLVLNKSMIKATKENMTCVFSAFATENARKIDGNLMSLVIKKEKKKQPKKREINENTKLLAYIWRFWRIGKLNRVLSKVNRHYSAFLPALYSKDMLTVQKWYVRVGVVWLSLWKEFTAWNNVENSQRSMLFHTKRTENRLDENRTLVTVVSSPCVCSIALVAYAGYAC